VIISQHHGWWHIGIMIIGDIYRWLQQHQRGNTKPAKTHRWQPQWRHITAANISAWHQLALAASHQLAA
jgi:hypothetical protein